MKTKRPESVSRRYGMRTRIKSRIGENTTDSIPFVVAEIRRIAKYLGRAATVEEMLRELAMAMTPIPAELEEIRSNLPGTDFDYDADDEPTFRRRPGH